MSEPLDWARMPYATLRKDKRAQAFLARWITTHEQAGHRVRKRLDGTNAMFEAFSSERGIRTLAVDLTARSDLDTQMLALARDTYTRPWRVATVREALGVPAIFRAASLISNVTGSLSMRALRDEVELAPQERPRIVIRPNPRRTPRDFYRDTAWNLARYGEAWWFVARRDTDGNAQSLFNIVSPVEVTVEENPDDVLSPHITWGNKSTRNGTLDRDDMRQITFLPDETGLRGVGPLQVCGAAVSVAVESQEWAANFFAGGGYPSIWIKAAGELGGGADDAITDEDADNAAYNEAQRLKAQWVETAPNTPRVTDESILDIKQFDPNPQGAQMLDARDYQNGDASRMYGIPGSILEYYRSGSSLTYQNLDDEFIKWVRLGLRPGYLEPIEQAMSDLLTRSTVARFHTEPLEAPNVKTRFEVYEKAVTVFGPEEGAEYARKREGLTPGDVENAPIPFAAPIVVPRVASLPRPSDRPGGLEAPKDGYRDVRCPNDGCGRWLARATGSVETWCRHCKATVVAA